MARSRLTDPLQVGRFHILDVSFTLPPVLLPVFGFTRVTLPTLNADIGRIKEGNYEYERKMIKGASVTPATFEQGVSLINSDFWDWIRKGVIGRIGPKNLLIVQFHGQAIFGGGALGLGGASKFLPFEFAVRLPGRAWFLKDCRPVSYRPGTDFDAMDQSVSLASLDVECEEFEEMSFGI